MKNKSFARFLVVWTGQLFSTLGTGMTAFALGVHVFEQTNSAMNFAMVMVTLFAPAILIGPLGGVLADRFDRRIMIIIGDAGSAAAVAFLLICSLSGELSIWNIYLGVALNSAFTALLGPAYKASLSDMLSESQFSKGGGLMQLASSARHLLAPVSAGFLLSISGIELIFLLDISSFAVAVFAVLFMPARKKTNQNYKKSYILTELKEGWQSLSAKPGVMRLVLKLAAVTFFAGCIQTLFTPMMLAITDVKTLGTIQSVSAMGMVAGSLIISITGLGKDYLLPLRLGLATGGLFLAAMGMSTNLFLITIFFFLFFLSLPLINTSAEVLIRTGISNHEQGRIWGLTGLLTQTGYIAAYLSAGFLSDRIFSPLLLEKGMLAPSLGRIIGTGPGRGAALILIICGLGLFFTAFTGDKQCCFLKLSKKN
ncbi:MAG: MFS transporter [Spirochaetia bacterium]|jgi:MFS family permease|nr:MFS transporter [Spirochaetia bacterium]